MSAPADPAADVLGYLAEPYERTRWQYRIVDLGVFFAGGRLRRTLAALGAEGWELVVIYDKTSNWLRAEKGFALFKRPVGPDEPAPAEGWAVLTRPDDLGAAPAGPSDGTY